MQTSVRPNTDFRMPELLSLPYKYNDNILLESWRSPLKLETKCITIIRCPSNVSCHGYLKCDGSEQNAEGGILLGNTELEAVTLTARDRQHKDTKTSASFVLSAAFSKRVSCSPLLRSDKED